MGASKTQLNTLLDAAWIGLLSHRQLTAAVKRNWHAIRIALNRGGAIDEDEQVAGVIRAFHNTPSELDGFLSLLLRIASPGIDMCRSDLEDIVFHPQVCASSVYKSIKTIYDVLGNSCGATR